MTATLRFWPDWGFVKVSNEEQLQLKALGVYLVGRALQRLEWALSATAQAQPAYLASFFGELRIYERVGLLEDIGREAGAWQDNLLQSGALPVPIPTMNEMRARRVVWDALVQERLGGLHLVTPATTLQPQKLMGGVGQCLPLHVYTFLEPIEVSDLGETCLCLLVGSPTAAEQISLRAAENLLRRWYKHETGNKIGRVAWGRVLDRLTKEFPETSRPKEIMLLGYLKQRRDEVAHPERVSELADAETTFMNVLNLARELAKVLPAPTPFDALLPPALQLETGSSEPYPSSGRAR